MLSLILGAAMAMQSADTIFVNGRIYVQKGRFEAALAVAGEKVPAVGGDGSMRAVRDASREPTGVLKDNAQDIPAEDLFKMEPRKILTTPVDLTMVGGRVVFERMPPHTP